MFMKILFFILCGLFNGDDRFLYSKFDLQPYSIVLNSTSISKFFCTKQTDDGEAFEISTYPIVTSDNIQIYERLLNKTMIEITINPFNYIGAFQLICSSIGNQSIGTRSDVFVGTSPGVFTHMKPCIVYENKYIECTIRAPTMVLAIHNEYPYYFDFMELRQIGQFDDVYNELPELVKIDSINHTITFRWYPVNDGIFLSGLNMLISGRLRDFGSTNITIDMTPYFWIKPNFTIEVLSSNYFQVHFNHENFLLPLFCRGNLTQGQEDFRILLETEEKVIHITDLAPNAWYEVCFQCHRSASIKSISEIQCLRVQTKRSFNWLIYSIIIGVIILTIIVIIIIYTICRPNNCIKKRITKCRCFRGTQPIIIEMVDRPLLNSVSFNPQSPLVPSPDETTALTKDTYL